MIYPNLQAELKATSIHINNFIKAANVTEEIFYAFLNGDEEFTYDEKCRVLYRVDAQSAIIVCKAG